LFSPLKHRVISAPKEFNDQQLYWSMIAWNMAKQNYEQQRIKNCASAKTKHDGQVEVY